MENTVFEDLWKGLYPGETRLLEELLLSLREAKARFNTEEASEFDRQGLIYCAYPDAFGDGLNGVAARMPYLHELGVKTLWLLPLLESPGRDQGFDISDYTQVSAALGGNKAFEKLLEKAREAGIQVIFDIAVNHTSAEHPWFRNAVDSPDSPYRNYYHWSPNTGGYSQAGLIFEGMVNSNWTYDKDAKEYYFHRFYPFQPDLNYSNPRVLLEMARILVNWKLTGVNGFRMDAAALLWKKEGTNCENLPEIHLILKLFKASLDFVGPGSLLLAEANLGPPDVLDFFGTGNECQAAYQFSLMPRFFQAMAEEEPGLLLRVPYPILPDNCSWFTFLRCHDEVTLDLVGPKDRDKILSHYLRNPLWSFRGGQAFSGRLFELLDRNPTRVLLAFSLLLSLPGTPILYYGDEIAMLNNEDFFHEQAQKTGFTDSRFLHRGPFDEGRLKSALAKPETPEGQVFHSLQALLQARSSHLELFRREPALRTSGPLLFSERTLGSSKLTLECNLSSQKQSYGKTEFQPWESRWTLTV